MGDVASYLVEDVRTSSAKHIDAVRDVIGRVRERSDRSGTYEDHKRFSDNCRIFVYAMYHTVVLGEAIIDDCIEEFLKACQDRNVRPRDYIDAARHEIQLQTVTATVPVLVELERLLEDKATASERQNWEETFARMIRGGLNVRLDKRCAEAREGKFKGRQLWQPLWRRLAARYTERIVIGAVATVGGGLVLWWLTG